MQILSAKEIKKPSHTYLIYGKPGVGKTSTMKYAEGRVLILDVDRLSGVLAGTDNVDIAYIDNIGTFDSWNRTVADLVSNHSGEYDWIVLDNLSELERCILSDLGRHGKNQGVPAQGDYQKMQFKIMDSIRYLKNSGANIVIMAWEQHEQYMDSSGQSYTMAQPQVNRKILNNVCGLCNCVARMIINAEGERGLILQPSNSTYAKNQIDARKGCLQDELFTPALPAGPNPEDT